tara:strand:- start:256 stop:414 length:159 start_codon:yes stop_codon:yes gene_type:complete
MNDITLKNKVEKHLEKVDGGGWKILQSYSEGVLIEWFNATRSYTKFFKQGAN